MVQKRRLLWVGDAGVATGFANCTHETLKAFHPSWDVHVLGVNYAGDPHPYPYKLYPCFPGGDFWGVGRIAKLTTDLRPDLIIIQNDHWNVPEYIKHIKGPARVIASMPVDGKNVKFGVQLNVLDGAIFWTKFGLEQAREGGYNGPAAVVGLGIDPSVYHPVQISMARSRLRLPIEPDDFLVGNINRNQPRKRLDLTIKYFANWVQLCGRKNARLLLHHSPRGKKGYDLPQLARYYGVGDKVLLTDRVEKRVGMPQEELSMIYSALDVQVSTAQGEGWGLTAMEGR
jgi:glycosyltransferase involved in cell wall biosynthesis